jgi:hypothetical protein
MIMLFKKIISVYSEKLAELINTKQSVADLLQLDIRFKELKRANQ